MNKPSWDDAPEWAKWLANDYDGAWYWTDYQPLRMHSGGVGSPDREDGKSAYSIQRPFD